MVLSSIKDICKQRSVFFSLIPITVVVLYWFAMVVELGTSLYAQLLFDTTNNIDVLFVWTYILSISSVCLHALSSFTKWKLHRCISVTLLVLFTLFHLVMVSTVVSTFGPSSVYTRMVILLSWYQCAYCVNLVYCVMCCSSSIACNIARSAVQTSIRVYQLPVLIVCCVPAFIQQIHNEYSTH